MQPEAGKRKHRGCLISIGIGVVVVLVIFLLVYFSGKREEASYRETGLISGEQLEELQQENLRKQIVSYGVPLLIDTLNAIYFIPVIPQTLKDAESFTEERHLAEEPVMSSRSSFKKGYDKSSVEYTNILLYSPLENEIKKLFSGRVLITSFKTYFKEEDILVVFDVVSNDDNKDNRVDWRDFHSLYMYSFRTGEMRMVLEENATVLNYGFIEQTPDLWVRVGIDRNKDGKYDAGAEPAEIRIFRFEERKLEQVVSDGLHEEMQRMVQGG